MKQIASRQTISLSSTTLRGMSAFSIRVAGSENPAKEWPLRDKRVHRALGHPVKPLVGTEINCRKQAIHQLRVLLK